MAQGMDVIKQAWEDRDGPAVLTTVAPDGKPNSVYVGEIQLQPGTGFIVADNYFDKTRRNIASGSQGSILFITGAGKSYQVKGAIEYHRDGPVFDLMRATHDPKHPGVAATVVQVQEAYSGSEKLL